MGADIPFSSGWAKSGREQMQQDRLFDHLIGAGEQ